MIQLRLILITEQTLWAAAEVWGTSPNLLIESADQRSSVEHVNGVAVYQEGPSPDGKHGAFLVSAVIAASPRAVFEVRHTCPQWILLRVFYL